MLYQAVIFDWAGTTVDFGSFAPTGVFVETFADFGIEVSIDEARAPMGLPKRAHIEAMLALARTEVDGNVRAIVSLVAIVGTIPLLLIVIFFLGHVCGC